MKRYLDIVKKHYEKFILGVVLLGLAGAVGYLPFKISQDQAELDQISTFIAKQVKELPPLETNLLHKALTETRETMDISLTAPPHNTINPVEWRRDRPGGPLFRSTNAASGPTRVEVVKITPLFLTVSWESVGGGGSNYLIRIEDQTVSAGGRRSQSRYLGVGDKFGPVVAKAVRTNADGVQELVLELAENKESVVLVQGKPFRRVGSHTAELRYDPEKQRWPDARVGTALRLDGEEFALTAINVIAPKQYEIVLSSKQTGKKTTIPFNAPSQP